VVIPINERDLIIEQKNKINFVKIVKAFEVQDVYWFCELQHASHIPSVTYFRRSLFKLIRNGVLVEVCKGKYAIVRNKN